MLWPVWTLTSADQQQLPLPASHLKQYIDPYRSLSYSVTWSKNWTKCLATHSSPLCNVYLPLTKLHNNKKTKRIFCTSAYQDSYVLQPPQQIILTTDNTSDQTRTATHLSHATEKQLGQKEKPMPYIYATKYCDLLTRVFHNNLITSPAPVNKWNICEIAHVQFLSPIAMSLMSKLQETCACSYSFFHQFLG